MIMWQSRVEIEAYSVAYFDRVSAFETQYDSVKGGALCKCDFTVHLSSTCSSSLKHRDAIEICTE